MKRLLICLFLSPLILCGCTRHLVSEEIPDHSQIDASTVEGFDFVPIEASTEEEYVEAAKAAGYVVNEHEAGYISGEEIIEDFYYASLDGKRCSAGIVDHYSNEHLWVVPEPGETEDHTPDVCTTYMTKLVYDG